MHVNCYCHIAKEFIVFLKIYIKIYQEPRYFTLIHKPSRNNSIKAPKKLTMNVLVLFITTGAKVEA